MKSLAGKTMDSAKAFRKKAKGALKNLHGHYVRRRFHFAPADLENFLRAQGVNRGDVLLLHSSYDRFSAFSGRPTDVIILLQNILQDEGTLLMPTMSFNGTAIEYVGDKTHFDLRRCPSRMGLITELFRRSKGVVRSVHPTHSVACSGKSAEELAKNHYDAKTPCGNPSPYAKLPGIEGKILFLGTGIGAMTLFHYVEEELEPHMPFSPFTEKVYELETTDHQGKRYKTSTRLFEPSVSRRRNLSKLKMELMRAGLWKEGRIGNLTTILLSASDVVSCCHSLAARGEFCYD